MQCVRGRVFRGVKWREGAWEALGAAAVDWRGRVWWSLFSRWRLVGREGGMGGWGVARWCERDLRWRVGQR